MEKDSKDERVDYSSMDRAYLKTNRSVVDRIGSNASEMGMILDELTIRVISDDMNKRGAEIEYARKAGNEVWNYLTDLAKNKDRFHYYMNSLEKRVDDIKAEYVKTKKEEEERDLREGIIEIFEEKMAKGKTMMDVFNETISAMEESKKDHSDEDWAQKLLGIETMMREYVGGVLSEDIENEEPTKYS